jgi:hypothetical protein
MNPYIRAAAKFPAMRARALERLGKRPARPERPAKPGGRVRARQAAGTFKADDPATLVVDEAWVEVL